jgi:hypothetical protein
MKPLTVSLTRAHALAAKSIPFSRPADRPWHAGDVAIRWQANCERSGVGYVANGIFDLRP